MMKAYIAAAFAVLTKGPIGLLLPGLILLVFIGPYKNSSLEE